MPKYEYDYPRPALAVDIFAIKPVSGGFRILLVERGNDPFKGAWAFPGGFVNAGESLMQAAQRELQEETSVDSNQLMQFRAYGDPGRDPRGWVVSVVFIAIVPEETEAKEGDDAAKAQWFSLEEINNLQLAFDHKQILNEALSDAQVSFGKLWRSLHR